MTNPIQGKQRVADIAAKHAKRLAPLSPAKLEKLAQLNQRAIEKRKARELRPITEDVNFANKMIATVVGDRVIMISESALNLHRNQ